MSKVTKLFFSPIILVLLLTILSFSLKINVIHCHVDGKNCSLEIYEKLESFKGKSLMFVNFDEILGSQEFQSEVILLGNYQKKLPGTLILYFNEEELLYQLNFQDNHLFVSKFGNILQGNQGKEDIVQVNLEGEVGNIVENRSIKSESHEKFSTIITKINNNNLRINSVDWISDNEIIINIEESPPIILDSNTIDSKIDIIHLLLGSKEIKDYDKPIKEIDLRINLPVLRTTQ